MMSLLTAAQMRAIETAAIESGQVTGLELMERAGRGVVDAMFETWPDLAKAPHNALVLCGPGNNGGDGFVVARLLKEWGWTVEVFLYGDPETLPPDARSNYLRWVELGSVTVHAINLAASEDANLPVPDRYDVLIDGLFGTGLQRPFQGPFTGFAKAREVLQGVRNVALDLPSGLCSDSGRVLGTAIPADLTVTFHSEKLGHRLDRGAGLCGRVVVKSIGLEAQRGRKAPASSAEVVRADEVVNLVAEPKTEALSKGGGLHKYAHGHALILSGAAGTGGAARLAARGALRIGAGLVSVVCEDDAVAEHAARLDAVMIKPANGARDLANMLADARFNALCLGPGLGLARAQDLVPVALEARRATVLDADALTAFQASPEQLFSKLHAGCVLTPHWGEFKRLFPDIAERLEGDVTSGPAYSKVDATRAAAARAGCLVLFKGADTVIADPSGKAFVSSAHYERAAPWLATAGSGDVLAGFVTGLLARGLEPLEAATTAAWLHIECARSVGPGLIAQDLPEALPKVFRALNL